MIRGTTIRRGLLCGLAALLLAGCGERRTAFRGDIANATPVGLAADPADRAAVTALYRRALAADERKVVVYSTTGSSEWEGLWRAFAATFPGMDVTYAHISPSQVITRINAEEATGHRFGDVFITPVNIAPQIADAGYFQPYLPPTLGALPGRYRDPKQRVYYPLAKVFGLAYNTDQVRTADLPPTLGAVLDPRWARSFTYIKPGSVNGTPDVAIAMMRTRDDAGDGQLKALRRNGAFAGIEAGVTYVSQGRQKLQLWAYLPTVVRQRSLGASVDMAFVPDFSVAVPFGTAISRDAPHPDAARLLIAWLFTPGAQAVLARDVNMLPTMPGAPLPPLMPADARARMERDLTELPPAELNRRLRAQQPGLKRIFNGPAT